MLLLFELRKQLVSVLRMGFGSAISEVGAVQLVGSGGLEAPLLYALARHDLVLLAVDCIPTRLPVNDSCKAQNIPLISGGIDGENQSKENFSAFHPFSNIPRWKSLVFPILEIQSSFAFPANYR